MNNNEALIVVDYQNGFIPEAFSWVNELWVEWGEAIAPRINELMRATKTAWGIIVATRDWHPQDHVSFASNHPGRNPLERLDSWQELWPDHCIANTKWWAYFSELDISQVDYHIIKGYEKNIDAYSGFEGKEDTPEGKKLVDILKDAGVEFVRVVGLATDFCVRATAVDAVKNSFQTIVDSSAIAGVMVQSPEGTVKYLQKLREEEWVDFV